MMEEVYANVDYDKPVVPRPPVNPSGVRSSDRSIHAALICLGLITVFLLAGLVGLGVHCESRSRDLDSALRSAANLSDRLQASDDKLSSLTKERDLLNASLTNMTRHLDRLQRLHKQEETCPAGWTLFTSACYFLSGKSGSWAEGKKDCTDRGAHLVVIDSAKEQVFLFGFTKKDTWIGLTDKAMEGSWKWVDGTALILTSWERDQPDNGGGNHQWGEEDCAHMTKESQKWNDRSCEAAMFWICEKTAERRSNV